MKKKLLPIALLAVLGLAAMTGCNDHKEPEPGPGPDPVQPEDVHVTGVTLDKATLALKEGQSSQLTATVAPSDATDKTVSWKSDNTAVATVSETGLVTAVKAGTAKVSVSTKDGNYKAECTVTVSLAINSLAISNKADFEGFSVGQNKSLELSIDPAQNIQALINNGQLVIASSDETVASVSGLKVYALKEGTAKITVTLADKSDFVELSIAGEKTAKDLYGAAHAGTEEDPLDNEDALLVAKHADYAKEKYYVKGEIQSFYHAPGSRTDGAVSWFLKPATEGGEKFEVYKCFKADASPLTDDDVWKGGVATALGSFTSYNGQYETDGAVFVSCEGEKPQPRQTLPATFAEALAAGAALADGDSSYNYYKFPAFVTMKSGTNYFLTATKGEALVADGKNYSNAIELYGVKDEALAAKLMKDAEIEITMELKNYHGQIEDNGAATIIEVTVTTEGGAWELPPEPAVAEKTLAEFIAAENVATVAYKVKATVKYFKNEGAAADAYGNLVLTDGTNDLVIYGSTAKAEALEWDGAKYVFTNPADFLTNEVTKDLTLGSVVTMKLIRADYKGTVQGKGIILSVEAGEEPAKEDVAFGEEYSWNPATSQSDIPGNVLTSPDTYYFWNDQNWVGSNVTMGDHYMQDGKLHFSFTSTGKCDFGFQLFYKNTQLEAGKKYTISFAITAENAGTIKVSAGGTSVAEKALVAGEKTEITTEAYTENERASFNLLAPVDGGTANSFVIENIKWGEYVEPVAGETTVAFDATDMIENPDAEYTGGSVKFVSKVLDDAVTVAVSGSDANTGKIYKSNDYGFQVRLYNSGKAAFTVTLANGYEFVSVKAKYAEKGSNWWVEPTEVALTPEGQVATLACSGKDIALYKVTVVYKAAEGGETPDPIVLPQGRFVATAELADGSKLPVCLNIGETISGYVGTTALTGTAKSYDAATGAIVIETPMGDASMKYDAENNKMLEFGVANNPASFKWNYGFSLFGNAKYFDCDGSDTELQAQFNRRYGSSSWTVDTAEDRIVSVEGGVNGKALQVKADPSKRYSLATKDFAEAFNARNLQFYIKGGEEGAQYTIQIFGYKKTGYSDFFQILGDTKVDGGKWVFKSIGFDATNIYGLQIIVKSDTVSAMFDDIIIY